MTDCTYKLESYRKEDDHLWNTSFGNNRELFMKNIDKNYENYYCILYIKSGNRWKEIASSKYR